MKRKVHIKKIIMAAVLLIICMIFMMTSCGGNPAAKKVSEDLDRLKANEAMPAGAGGLGGVLEDLSDDVDAEALAEMTEDYTNFMAKVRSFDYEILATEEDPEEYRETADNITVVEVRIRTYDFGREYVKTWADHLEKAGESSQDSSQVSSEDASEDPSKEVSKEVSKDASDGISKDTSEDFDETSFYRELFMNLSETDEKDYLQTVKIKVTETEKDGTLTTDVNKNKKLHNAILGGMLNEMNELASW